MFLQVLSLSKRTKKIITYERIALNNSVWSGNMDVKDNRLKETDCFDEENPTDNIHFGKNTKGSMLDNRKK